MPVYALFDCSLSAPVDREEVGTLRPRLNDFNGLTLNGRRSLGVNFGRPASIHSEIMRKRRGLLRAELSEQVVENAISAPRLGGRETKEPPLILRERFSRLVAKIVFRFGPCM